MGRTNSARGAVPAWKRSCSLEGEPHVELTYRDAPGGSTVLFTTAGDPTYLRRRVTEVARYHNSAAPTIAMHDLAAIPHTAMVQDIEGGIALTLFATNRQHVETLRINVQQDVWAMQKRGCGAGQEAL
jgi:hypothetical protein